VRRQDNALAHRFAWSGCDAQMIFEAPYSGLNSLVFAVSVGHCLRIIVNYDGNSKVRVIIDDQLFMQVEDSIL